MKTKMTRFRGFSKMNASLSIVASSLSIGKVNDNCAKQSHGDSKWHVCGGACNLHPVLNQACSEALWISWIS